MDSSIFLYSRGFASSRSTMNFEENLPKFNICMDLKE